VITIEKVQARIAKAKRPDGPITTSLVSGVHLREVIEAIIAEVNEELKKKVDK